MTVTEFYKKVEGNYESIKGRLKSDERIFIFLNKFRNEQNYTKFMSAVEANDMDKLLLYANQLIDVAGTLSLDKFVEVMKCFLVQLREENRGTIDKRLINAIKKEYQKTIKYIDEI